jgi:hypothetical protein
LSYVNGQFCGWKQEKKKNRNLWELYQMGPFLAPWFHPSRLTPQNWVSNIVEYHCADTKCIQIFSCAFLMITRGFLLLGNWRRHGDLSVVVVIQRECLTPWFGVFLVFVRHQLFPLALVVTSRLPCSFLTSKMT